MEELNIGGLKIQIPIIQGGMGVGVSLSGLAVAVANQGGVGVISSAGLGLLYRHSAADFVMASIEGLKEEIRMAKEKTMGVIGVNVMSAMSNFKDMVVTAINEKVDIIFAGAGLPLDLPSFLKPEDKTKLVPIVSSGRAAKIICSKWESNYNYLPDAFVVEGPKAGGHLGFKKEDLNDERFALEVIVKDVIDEVRHYEESKNIKIPIIAAGGIYTGADMYDIMKLGAKGVQLGSRFVTTVECDASPLFKQEYIKATEKDIEIINSPVGMPGRAIHNEFLESVKNGQKIPKKCPFKCIKSCDVENSPYCIINALYNAYKGNFKFGFAFAGSNAYKAFNITTVKEVFTEFIHDFNKKLLFDN